MDPFDEFEFKPLTEGLGFQKKPKSLKEQVQSAGLTEEHLAALPTAMPRISRDPSIKPMTFDDVISSLEKAPLKSATAAQSAAKQTMAKQAFLDVTEPLPRPKEKIRSMEPETSRPIHSPFPTPEILGRTVPNPAPAPGLNRPAPVKSGQNVGARRGANSSPTGRLIATPANIPASILDLVISVALSLLFLAVLLTATKVDLSVVLKGAQNEGLTRVSLVIVFIAVLQMYLVVARSFFARTLGEWTFDVQLGKSEEHDDTMYPFKVMLRCLVTMVTGFVLLPILSLILKSDLAGEICGLRLYQQT